ncbi:MAG TPA: bifunctional phosphoribosylaminoimidazolecarboxamide formyltransferase/IMP cyclohydrolase [Sphingobacteriaceae bacterium]|nr:bifunctional phosphoribosylaminoimidazolecarboxamide formyltransferase/IMP cyclohydrolase [Sphingobacteriaceae bacterium]
MTANDAGAGRVRRALLSVADKRGIEDLGRALAAAGFELVSTGGTLAALAAAGLQVVPVDQLTGFPAMLGGRVKTLHPAVHGAILGRRDREEDMADWARHGLQAIDLVAVNLYPFETAWHGGAQGMDLLEQIDIGGPAMIRAAAKNWPWVTVVVDPDDYPAVIQALQEGGAGGISEELRRRLAARAFAHTAYYDAVVAAALGQEAGETGEAGVEPPQRLVLPLRRTAGLRYGENPHQKAAVYRDAAIPPTAPGWQLGLPAARQLQGKELSFNNLQDAEAAWRLVSTLVPPAAVAVKHTIPCGAACGPDPAEAFRRARDADPVSIFGGIVALNRVIDEETARLLADIFLEVVLAPGVSPEAQEILAGRANLRVLTMPLPPAASGDDGGSGQGPAGAGPVGGGASTGPVGVGLAGWDVRRIQGGVLLQDEDDLPVQPDQWRVATKAQPPAEAWDDMLFAWHLVRHLPSNAIVLVKDQRAVGIGAARTSRVDAVRQAVAQAGEAAQGAVMASDAFFPFPDGVEVAAEGGVKVVVQPGGSIRDQEVVDACDRLGVAMLMTGVRHFRH